MGGLMTFLHCIPDKLDYTELPIIEMTSPNQWIPNGMDDKVNAFKTRTSSKKEPEGIRLKMPNMEGFSGHQVPTNIVSKDDPVPSIIMCIPDKMEPPKEMDHLDAKE